MAVGIMLVGFVVVHMIGNLQLYPPAHEGVYPLDTYGTFLRTLLHGSASDRTCLLLPRRLCISGLR